VTEKPRLDMSREQWQRVIAVDRDGAFYTAKAFVP
jgi:NAD(P)-dependent dehydrogenase (short-subunit alcohol dehydrogenase family)